MKGISPKDLDASAEMLAFMWVAAGYDPTAVSPDALAIIKALIGEGFPQLPLEFQLLFHHGEANYQTIRADWETGDPLSRLLLVQKYRQLLATMGLAPDSGSAAVSQTQSGGESLNADIASNIAWHASGAGDWSAR